MPILRTCFATACLILAAIGPSWARAGEGSGSIVGNLKLGSGPTVVYDYHFDHNAFADSVDLPGGLIALTVSGNLIRFDPEALKSTREWFGPSRVTCIGPGGLNSALIGLEDGRIARLDPTTLAFTVVATLPGKPHWVGTKAGDRGGVAVVERWKWLDATVSGFGQRGFRGISEGYGNLFSRKTPNQEWRPDSDVHDLATGQSCAIGGRASTAFLDRKDRVWLGFEMGEFGGWCRCVALTADRAGEVRGPFDPADGKNTFQDGVNGFTELSDGRVLILGAGGQDLGSFNIDRVDVDRLETLVSLRGEFGGRGFGPGKPDSAIERMVEEPGGSLLALSEDNSLYRTTPKLERWDLVHNFNRGLSLQSYALTGKDGQGRSAIRAIHLRKGSLVCATIGDGYLRVVGDRQERDPAPGQLAVLSIGEIQVTPTEALFRDSGDGTPWRLENGQWSIVDDDAGRRRKRTFATPDRASWAIGPPPDAVGEDRGDVGAGKVEPTWQLRREAGDQSVKVADLPGLVGRGYERIEYLENFELLHWADGEEKRIRRRDGKGFPMKGPVLGASCVGDVLRVVNEAGPRWAIFDREEEQLFGMAYGPTFQDARFAPIAIEEGGLPLKVYDALAWSREDILIATRKGLKLCEIATGKYRPAPLPSPDRPVLRLARDGSNRLWLGGEGLWMVDPAGRLHDLGEVPMVGRSKVMALAADGRRKDGVIVSFGERGVAFIRAEVGP